MRQLPRSLSVVVLLGISYWNVIAQPATALPPPTPTPLGRIQGQCRNVEAFYGGRMDDFAAPADPVVRSPGLQNHGRQRTLVGYDTGGRNRHVGDSFRFRGLRGTTVCFAVLEARVRYTTLDPNTLNDTYAAGILSAAGNDYVSGPVWRSGDPKTKTLSIELPRERIAAMLARSPDWLDVWLQDETIVDWIRLTIVYQ